VSPGSGLSPGAVHAISGLWSFASHADFFCSVGNWMTFPRCFGGIHFVLC
jgi:hypothetical protein